MNTTLRNFCFTLNNYTEQQYNKIKENVPTIAKYAVIGEETGDEKETNHLQGYIQLTKVTKFKTIKQWFLDNADGSGPHIEKAKGNPEQNYVYCTKQGKFWEFGQRRRQGQRTDIEAFLNTAATGANSIEIAQKHPVEFVKYWKAAEKLQNDLRHIKHMNKLINYYKDAKLRGWQKVVLKKLDKQNNRQVTWVFDPVGGLGKTWFAGYLQVYLNAFVIEGGKKANIAYAYNEEQRYVVFDFTREKQDLVSYSLIESFKNGRIFSEKYESRNKVFRPCKVLCLSNFYPDISKLSHDRWQILEFKKEFDKTPFESKGKDPTKEAQTTIEAPHNTPMAQSCSHNNCNEINCFCDCHIYN